jgi:hypothetical protein
MDGSREELKIKDGYSWKLMGLGNCYPKDSGEPNFVIEAWDLSIAAQGLDDEGAEEDETTDDAEGVDIGKVAFSVVNQGAAINRGEDLEEVYDAEDDFHYDFYEHVAGKAEFEELLSVSRVVLLTSKDLLCFKEVYRLDVLQIIDQIFNDAVVAVWCEDFNDEVGVQLGVVMDRLPPIGNEGKNSGWLYHNGCLRWMTRTLGKDVS